MKPAPKLPNNAEQICSAAHALLGVREIPDGSNDGPQVHRIQESTGAFKAPWCVSTVQFIWHQVFGIYLAERTANAYALADYGERHGWQRGSPVVGGPVVYRIGAGHAGTVVQLLADGSFYAVEGNEGNAVRLMHRSPSQLQCVFLHPPGLNP